MGAKLMSKEELKEQLMRDNTKKNKQNSNKTQTDVAFVMSSESNKKEEIVRIMDLNTKDLVSNQPYQRDINQKEVAYIVSNFDPHQIGVIKVSYRDGKYYVYDGQHRITAFKIVNGN